MYISETKIKAKHIVVFALCLAFMICTLGIGAFANDAVVLNKPVITATETGYDFFVTANGFSGSANAVVAAYGSSGECVEKDVAPMDGDGANLTLSADSRGLDYKVMLLENNLKPICDFLGGVVKPEPKILELITSDIVNMDEYGIEYFIDSANSNLTKTAKFSVNSEFLYNRVSIDKTKLLGSVENGDVIVLKDMDADDKYDVMEVEHYEYDRIRKIDSDAGEFMLETAGTVEISDAVFEDLDGSPISLDDLKRYDVIAIMTDTGNVESYGNIRIVRITDSFVEGTVDEMYLLGNQYCIVIDDVEYVLKDDDLADTGDTGIFYVGIDGSIVYCPPKNPNYGYILEGAVDDSAFSGNIWQLKMLVAKGDSQEINGPTFELAAGGFSGGGSSSSGSSGGSAVPETGVGIYEVRKSYNDTVGDYINDNFSQELNQDGTSFLFDHSTSDLLNPARLITYELDGSGDIKEIAMVSDRVEHFDAVMADGEYNADTQKLGGVILEDNTVVFNVCGTYADETYITDISYLRDGAQYSGFVAPDMDGDYEVVVITDELMTFDASEGFAVVTEASLSQNADGEEIYKISYVQGGEEGTIIFDDDSQCINSREYDYIPSVGEVFVFIAGAKGNVSEYAVVAKYDDSNGILELTEDFADSDEAAHILGEDAEILLGYITNTSKNVVSKGEVIYIGEEPVLITSDTKTYLLDNTRKYNSVVITDNLFTGNADYFDETENAGTIVLAGIYDGSVNAVYALNQRVNIEDMAPVDSILRPAPGNGEPITISMDALANPLFDGRVFEYYTDAPQYTTASLKKLSVNNTATLIINNQEVISGQLISPAVLADNFTDGMVTFNDTDSDGYYDVIDAEQYVYDVVEDVDHLSNRICLKSNGTMTLDFENSDIEIILEDDEGNEISLTDLAEGDYIAIAADNVNPARYSEYIRIVKLNSHKISGKAEEIGTRGIIDFAVINEVKYDLGVEDISVGAEGIFYLDLAGKIVGFESTVKVNYAYILEGAIASGAFTNDQWQLKLLTEDGIDVYGIRKASHSAIADYIMYNFDAEMEFGDKFLFNSRYVNPLNPARLITYELDGSGDIKEIAMVSEHVNGFDAETADGEYNAGTQKLGGVVLEDDTIVFNVCERYAAGTYSGGIDILTDGARYTGLVAPNRYGEYKVAVISEETFSFSEADGFAVVTEVAMTLNGDGEDVLSVSYLRAGEEGEVILTDDSECSGNIWDIEKGDVFIFVADKNSAIMKYAVIAKLGGDGYGLDLTGDADRVLSDTEIIYGYIENTSEIKSAKGEVITVGGEDILISSDANTYLLENSRNYTSVVKTEELFCENVDYFDEESGAATFVLANLYNGNVTDVYALNLRVNPETNSPVENIPVPAAGNGETVEISMNSLANIGYEGRVFEYYTDAPEYTVTALKRLTVNESSNLIVNNIKTLVNKEISPYMLADYVMPGGMLTFEDTDTDGYYDVINAKNYLYDVIDFIDFSRGRIALRNSGAIYLDFEADYIDIILRDDKGNELTLEDFGEGDVVAVAADTSRPSRYEEYIEIVKLTNSKVSGTVEKTMFHNGKNYVVVDGKKYGMAIYDELAPGDIGTFYFGLDGDIIYFESDTSGSGYAYILDGVIVNDAFANDQWQLKMLTEDGVQTFDISKNYHDTVNNYIEENFVGTSGIYKFTFGEAHSGTTWNGKLNMARLVTYSLNNNGEIEELCMVSENPAYFDKSIDEYRADSQRIGGKFLADDVIIFDVQGRSVEDTYVTDISALVDEGKYTGYTCANRDAEYDVMVITDSEIPLSEDTGFAIVTKVSTGRNEYGEEVTKISYVQNEEEGVITIDDDTECENATAIELAIGDAFMFVADGEGLVSKYKVIATLDGNAKNNKVFKLTAEAKDAETNFGDNTEIVTGFILNEKYESTSKGEIITVGRDSYLILDASYKYTYNAVGRNVVIDTGDFMSDTDYAAQDLIDMGDETIYASPVLLRLVDGVVVDVYATTARIAQ